MLDDNFFLESNVRTYSRAFPAIFDRAEGAWLTDNSGQRHLDFLAGCGSLNYGHNHPELKQTLARYIERDGICMSMDLQSVARQQFLTRFKELILDPRGLDHLVQFPGPTGANAVEAAIKLARKVTGRSNVISFTNGFHGCSLGALALTGSQHHRASSSGQLNQVTRMPYEGYMGDGLDTAEYLEQVLNDPSSGVDAPAAIILETVQGEGGLQTASKAWMQRVTQIAHDCGALLIVDDIQAGCGRTGSFFSFEPLGIVPDIICMAKAISGYGLPMALVLLRPELDVWSPGEHNGTFRGNNFAFVCATAALETFWADPTFTRQLQSLCARMDQETQALATQYGLQRKGRGAMLGLQFSDLDQAKAVQQACVQQGLIIELCGPRGEVLKFLPPLTLTDAEWDRGIMIVASALNEHASPQDKGQAPVQKQTRVLTSVSDT
ncbi:MAG: diaminobutyrate--2-oxoglutarate transaminase [Colwellia sp.]|nr:diaminobutyrate--2-oxoglutarate transaminase [Colwellia sp.]